MLFDRVVLEMLGMGILESLYMTFVSSFIAYAIGLPTGILLVITDSDGVLPKPMLNKIVGLIVLISFFVFLTTIDSMIGRLMPLA